VAQTYTTLKVVGGSFGPDSDIATEASIPVPY